MLCMPALGQSVKIIIYYNIGGNPCLNVTYFTHLSGHSFEIPNEGFRVKL